MDILHAIVLGVIEGVTEFLPVSSTGHMIIASHLMQIPDTDFLKTFEIAIQLGAIAAVAGLYWRTFLLDWEITLKVMVAFIPTAVIGFILYKLIKHFLLGNVMVVVWSLFLGGVFIILFERFYKSKGEGIKDINQISYLQAIIIGLCQSLAVVPGVSRSAATILGGLSLGVSRKTIVEFSFLLAVPTMMAATVLDLLKTDADLSRDEWGILALGFVVAFVVAWLSVKFFLKYIQRHNFTAFGIYRVAVAIVFLFFFSPTTAFAQEPLTLKQCYELALKRSETIAIDEQVIKEAQAQFLQSFSGVLPQIDYGVAKIWQDNGRGNNHKGNSYQRFTFSQPLFSGFKEFAAIAGARAQRRERQQQLNRAKQLLFTDVSDAFYFYQSYQEELQVVEGIQKALADRVTELNHRIKVGRSRQSEVASAEASLYKAQADAEDVRSQLEVGRQLLEFLIGQPVIALEDEALPTSFVKSLDDLILLADNRPDVLAAKEAVTVAHKNITIARSGFLPSVSANGNSYTQRKGSNSDWDVTLNVNMPLFNGTQTIGDVKLAQAQAKEAELLLSQAKRTAVLDIQGAYTRWSIDQKREIALKKAADAAQVNYRLQSEDYGRNLVNNLDVLQSLQDLEDAKRDYISVKNEAKRFYWNLKIATGQTPD